MSIRWTIETTIATVAMALTAAGNLWTTSFHLGKANEQIQALQKQQDADEARLNSNAAALSEQRVHDAAVEQSLQDVIKQLDRIEKKL